MRITHFLTLLVLLTGLGGLSACSNKDSLNDYLTPSRDRDDFDDAIDDTVDGVTTGLRKLTSTGKKRTSRGYNSSSTRKNLRTTTNRNAFRYPQ